MPKPEIEKHVPTNSAATPLPPAFNLPTYAWWLVLSLVGLDYFSTIAYLPSIEVTDSGFDFSVLIALLTAVLTLLVALPIYFYIAGRSPHGLGVTGLLESYVRGWRGKLLVLLLLGFIATDFIVTRTLSAADASTHFIHNFYWKNNSAWVSQAKERVQTSLPEPIAGPFADSVLDWWNEQLTVTVILSILAFALYFLLWRGFTRGFLYAAAIIVGIFLVLNGTVIISSVIYLAHNPDYMIHWKLYHDVIGNPEPVSQFTAVLYACCSSAPASAFGLLALGLSGFELSMVSIGLVRGRPNDDPVRPRGRIRNARKLLVAAALLMSVFVIGSVLSVRLLVPTKALEEGGPARNRALAYLAHGGPLEPPAPDPKARRERPEDQQAEEEGLAQAQEVSETPRQLFTSTAVDLNPLFGPVFGTLYDLSAILTLFLAGASVTVSLRNLLPLYLHRYGMEMPWARRHGLLLHLFNLAILLAIFYFHASVSHQIGAYAASVYVLLASAALAVLLDTSSRWKKSLLLPLLSAPLFLICVFFLLLAGLVVWHSPAGGIIVLLFIIVLLVTASLARWRRRTELRDDGFTFADEETALRWNQVRRQEFQVLAPYLPDDRTFAEKEAEIRSRHRLGPDVPIIFIEAKLGNPRDSQQQPLMQIVKEDGREVIRVSECSSIPHVLAAIALEFREVGRRPEMYFAWSGELPPASSLRLLLFGEGNLPWLVHALILKVESNVNR